METMVIGNRALQLGLRALVVASGGHDLSFLEALFADRGWHMIAVSSVQEGTRHIQNHSHRLVICDDQMEDGDWHALLDAASHERNPPHLIVTSRLADDCLWAEVLNRGGYDLLAKPYEPSEVIRIVGAAWVHQSSKGDAPLTLSAEDASDVLAGTPAGAYSA